MKSHPPANKHATEELRLAAVKQAHVKYAASAKGKASVAKWQQKRVSVVREAKSKPCADCGHLFHYCCMDFDHRPGEEKKFEIARRGRSSGVETLLAEIAKCDVVCANCHRLRTWKRQYGGTSES